MVKTVSFHHIEEIQKILDRLIKKAKKHNVEFKYTVSDTTYYKTVNVFEAAFGTVNHYPSGSYQVEVVDIELSDTIICANGWTVMAHIEHMEGGHNIVTPISITGEIPANWYTMSGNCDHCNSIRNRTKTYIVERDGNYRQVGKSCLKEYTGIFPGLAIMWAEVEKKVINDVMEGENVYMLFGTSIPKVYSVIDVIALAIDSISEFGYVKSDGLNPTKERIYKMLKDEVAATKNAKTKAAAICEYVAEYENPALGMHDIIVNAKAIVISEYCKHKHIGRLAYLPVAVEREKERERKAAERVIEAAKSDYIGSVGEKITVELSASSYISSFETQYGYTMIYRFVDITGNVLIWFSSRGINLDNAKTLTGTIKNHNEHNGEKQTIVTRCKVS